MKYIKVLHIYNIMDTNMNYNIEFIYKLKQEGFNYEIPERTMYLINKISKQVGAPTYSRTPIFKKKLNSNYDNTLGVKDPFNYTNFTEQEKNSDSSFKIISKKKNKNVKQKSRVINDNEWKNIRSFETTKIEKNEEGIEKELNKIRIQLNKLTDKTFLDVKMELFDIINSFINDVNEDDLLKVSNMIFDVGSSNGFYAKQYSLLYKDLMEKYNIMERVLTLQFKDVFTQITDVKNADPEEDYEEFCVVNSQNDKIKSITRFMAYMFNEEIISKSDMYSLLNNIIDLFVLNINMEKTAFICEHLCDIIFEIIQVGGDNLKKCDEKKYGDIMELLEEWSELNIKNYPSYTNKSKFKLMDIIELME